MRFEPHLAKRDANFQPLSPVDFLVRAADAYTDRTAVVWNDRRWSYRQFSAMAERFRARLADFGVGKGDVVSIISPNRPEMLAAHYAIPALGAVLNAINLRLDAGEIAYILAHAETRVLIADPGSIELARAAARQAGIEVIPLGPSVDGFLPPLDLLSAGAEDAGLRVNGIDDEWQPLALNYTSGTTGRPKGVVYNHRGAYLNALGNVLALGFDRASAYLWTLPMFHCNGWCHTWAVTAAAATHVCLDRPDPPLIFRAMERYGVTHFACAPVVLYMLLNHPDRPVSAMTPRVVVGTGGAAPTSALIEQLDAVGIDIIHLYGLTESYGPLTLCTLPEELDDAAASARAGYLARQGTRHVTASDVRVVDDAGAEVPADGVSLGEIRLRGNTVMAGYYRDEASTEAAFAGGWLKTGDLAVRDPDGAVAIRDRSKDIIISGGENISSIEIESALHQHPAVLMAAVVAAPHPKWGEVPCAFIELKPGHTIDGEELRAFCRGRLPGFKQPKLIVFQELPKTATGKVQKFMLREEARRLAAID